MSACTRPTRIRLIILNNYQWVEMYLHSDTLSSFRANQSFLLNAACLADKQQIPG